jgi:alkanesulfonate monooxygenase SsuD/methylene tetrahydromethanopterin reductase-like flavin-dependent oxidoreductase (luciferase family)
MKFGVALPYVDARTAADLARLAEESGWDGVFMGDAIWCTDPLIALTAAAMVTSRICLGVMVIPVPLRRPWKIASEAAALDNLSGGRLILGLATGAVWMGWYAFPDEVTDTRTRAEMLDETIDILTLLFQGKPFDYDGIHYHLHLTQLSEQYYPPSPVQRPRIPLWVVGAWPRKKSMRRILKCDGLLPQKIDSQGQFEEVLPADVREMKAYLDANRDPASPFDIIAEGKTGGLSDDQMREKIQAWQDAGATWWIEGLWEESREGVMERLRQGPPPNFVND